jgi:hypothetical protein
MRTNQLNGEKGKKKTSLDLMIFLHQVVVEFLLFSCEFE